LFCIKKEREKKIVTEREKRERKIETNKGKKNLSDISLSYKELTMNHKVIHANRKKIARVTKDQNYFECFFHLLYIKTKIVHSIFTSV
jgi:hypothetical protein